MNILLSNGTSLLMPSDVCFVDCRFKILGTGEVVDGKVGYKISELYAYVKIGKTAKECRLFRPY